MIHKTQLSVESKANAELNELLGKDISNTEEWHDITLILSKVAIYMPFLDDDNIPVPSKTCIYFNDGAFVINTPYAVFEKIILDYLNRNNPVT